MFNFDHPVDRHGSWCTQWDFVADRFGDADLLPFTISDMDFATAPVVLEALQQRISHGVFGYSRWQHAEFLDAIVYWYQQRFQLTVDSQQIVYGPSVIYMVAQLIRQWSAPGDGVVVHTPAYDAFGKTIDASQRQLLAAPLEKRGQHWHCDMTQLENLLARDNCKIMLLCSPHNPTGKVWQAAELAQMAKLCQRHQVKVISDEIHMDMVMGNTPHTPWISVARGPYALFTSASKSFNIPALTGAYGFISQPEDRAQWMHTLKQADGLSSPAVMAIAAHIAAYRYGAEWLDALRAYLLANLRYVAGQLNQYFPELNWHPPEASYLAWLDLRPLGLDDQRLQQNLIKQQKVAIMPGDTYGVEGSGFLRLNVGCPRNKVEQGVERLINGIKACR
ncbi:pyridoxal phosphate-dependent aminotransferase [Erwiniaceae bacterium BAC15a-03b]|uniref:cysteine-S-conjugate beta-lyase n=1 Tax=Winslowiella arboricola TaxID=2978220 RepID=A0A9J6PNB4_9GAMM|nr:MalY/PatB family protein [Winslowiella arboricola]MCU5772398.1 pyridoxal phosphate-dependent aminotransferase [Winslowiella arboricola]MCU5779809.1 pyridoxal phosphate-dependent aminotransferase [Winslowiella arboricola]